MMMHQHHRLTAELLPSAVVRTCMRAIHGCHCQKHSEQGGCYAVMGVTPIGGGEHISDAIVLNCHAQYTINMTIWLHSIF